MSDVDGLIAAAEERWKASWAAGPQRTRWTSLPPQLGDAAPDADLVAIGRQFGPPALEAWGAGPALILFWRHFGCSVRDGPSRAVGGGTRRLP